MTEIRAAISLCIGKVDAISRALPNLEGKVITEVEGVDLAAGGVSVTCAIPELFAGADCI